MSFEADAAGLAVADEVAASIAADRRILVDDYTRLVINDVWVNSKAGRATPAVQAEAAATSAMFQRLAREGCPVRVTNPVGRWKTNYPARNHKKMIVADDVAYIGGVNFCDHNFLWHDLMLRLADGQAADFLAADFAATFDGQPRPANAELGAVRLISMDGRRNHEAFAEVTRLIEGAAREITVISPYLTFPFTDVLAQAAGRGVAITLITPWANNKPIVRDALLWTARRAGFAVTLLPAMSHMKGLLVDGRCLVLGSSNFDFASLAAEEEMLALISDASLVADFQARVIEPALKEALPEGHGAVSALAGLASGVGLRIAERVAMAARGARRTAADWPD